MFQTTNQELSHVEGCNTNTFWGIPPSEVLEGNLIEGPGGPATTGLFLDLFGPGFHT